MVHEQNKIISDYRIKNSYITSLLESKQMQFEDVQHRCKFMETDARLKQATLNSLRENFATLKSKQDEKLKALGSGDPKLYEKSKEKYKSLLTRYKKLVDEKLLVEKKHGELLLANANIKLQYDTLLAQNEGGNDDSESIKADKEKYKKLSDRFEKLTDTKNAIVHEKSNLEEEHETYKKNNSTGTIDKLKNEFTELQQKFEGLELGHTNKVEEVNNLTQKKLSLKNKLKEAKLTVQKLEKVKRDYTKTIEDLTIGNLKLYEQKEVIVNELIGLRESQMQCEEQEKTHREAKRTKNRLIRDTNKLNKILQDKIISLELTIFKLNQELETFQGQTLEAKFILDIAKQEEMVHQ